MKTLMICATALSAGAALMYGQASPAQTATWTSGGKTVTIKYNAPSVKGRKIFGDGGLVMKDPGAPVWRAGANAATALHTDADLTIGDLSVPAGDYTLFVNVKDENAWDLIVSKETKQWGLAYKPANDLGRVKMKMSKPAAPVEMLKYSITGDGKKAVMQIEWENHVAAVPMSMK